MANDSDPLFRVSGLGLVFECKSTSIPIPCYDTIDWIPATPASAHELSERAVVAGYEGHDNSPLWVVRARFKNDLVPGKLAIKWKQAFVAFCHKEHEVFNIEVCCAASQNIRWLDGRDGFTPPNAVVGGCTSSGEHLYIGRTNVLGSLTPGKIHPSHGVMYVSHGFKELTFKNYEVLCTI